MLIYSNLAIIGLRNTILFETNETKEYSWIDERICTTRWLSSLVVYAPDEVKGDQSRDFYELQNILDKTNKNDYVIIGRDYNTRIG